MILRKATVAIIFSVMVLSCFGQNTIEIVFDQTTYNFGTIAEDEGQVEATFSFVNLSNTSLIITGVDVSCGCTTPQYSGVEIKRGEKGYINVRYNPMGRPGAIQKSLTVKMSNGKETRPVVLRLAGYTLPKGTSDAEYYTGKIGDLELRTKFVDMGSILLGNTAYKSIEIHNPTDKTIKVDFTSVPNNINIHIDGSAVIEPMSSAVINITYDSSKGSPLGYTTNKILLKANKRNAGEIEIQADVKEDFTNITPEEFAQKPEIWLFPQYINVGAVKAGKPQTAKVKVENRGISPLRIHNVVAAGMPFIGFGKFKPSVISPGESVNIDITIDATGIKRGDYRGTLQVISNDCESPITDLFLDWKVE